MSSHSKNNSSLSKVNLRDFRGKYGFDCQNEDAYLDFVSSYGIKPVQAFIDYVLSAEPIDIDTAVSDLERFFRACIVDSKLEQQSEFHATDDFIYSDGYCLNMSLWGNSHIQCFSCKECLEKAQDSNLSDEEIVRYLNKAFEFDPNSEEVLLNRASYLESLGCYNDAIRDLKRYLLFSEDIDQKNDCSLQIIDLYILAKNCSAGLDFVDECIQRDPNDEYFIFGKAKLLFHSDLINEAKDVLKLLNDLGHGTVDDNLSKLEKYDAWL